MYGSLRRAAMTPVSTPGIQYLSHKFTEPRLLGLGLTPPIQGIYAVVTPDASFKPRPFRLLYIGETENLSARVTASHEKYDDWKRAASTGHIFVAYHGTIGMSAAQRKAIEGGLIAHYDPPCNVMLRGLRSLYRARTTY